MKVTSIKEYINVLKHPSVWLVAFLVLCCYSAQVASEYTTPYLSRVLGMTVVMAGVIATIRSYGIGIFSAPIIGKIADKVGSYSKTVIGLLIIEIILATALLILPGQPSVVILAIILVLCFAVVMYALRGVYYATMGEAGVPYALTGTATGIISVVGYLPDFYMSMILGGFLDRYPGAPGFKFVFGSIIIFAGLGIVVASIIYILNRKRSGKETAEPVSA
jgi:predicted MFS family arabinose efflux permease